MPRENAACPCRGCHQTAQGHEMIEEFFGYRDMGDGRVIPQSYCRKCRGLHCKAAEPKCN